MRFIRHAQSCGGSAARNHGIFSASGRWIAFCDDDDLWAPTKLQAQLRAMQENNASWSCTGEVLVDDNLTILGHQNVRGGDLLRDLLSANVLPSGGSAVIVNADLARSLGGFDETLRLSEDWEFWIRIAQKSVLAAVDAPMIAHRQTNGSASTNVEGMRKGRDVVLDRYRHLIEEISAPRDDINYERYLAKQLLRAGAGAKAAAIYRDIAVRHRRWNEVPRIVTALVAPRLADAVGNRRSASRVPRAWRAEAEAWIGEFLASQDTSVRSGMVADVPR